jgi:hypothetical protein
MESPQIKKIDLLDDSVAGNSVSSREPSSRTYDRDEFPATLLPGTKTLAVCVGDDLREIDLTPELPEVEIPTGFALVSVKFGIFLSWDTQAILWDATYGLRHLQNSDVNRRYHCLTTICQSEVLVISG